MWQLYSQSNQSPFSILHMMFVICWSAYTKKSFYISFVAFSRFYHKRKIIDYFPLCIICILYFSVQGIYMRCESISSLPRELHASFWFYENRSLLYAHHDLLTDFKPNDPSSVFYFIWGIFFHTSFMYIHDWGGGGFDNDQNVAGTCTILPAYFEPINTPRLHRYAFYFRAISLDIHLVTVTVQCFKNNFK